MRTLGLPQARLGYDRPRLNRCFFLRCQRPEMIGHLARTGESTARPHEPAAHLSCAVYECRDDRDTNLSLGGNKRMIAERNRQDAIAHGLPHRMSMASP